MARLSMDIQSVHPFSHEDRVEIFRMADKLAGTVGIEHIKISSAVALVIPQHESAGRERTQVCLDYKLVFNLDDETMVDLKPIIFRARFTAIDTCAWFVEPIDEQDLEYKTPPEFLQPTFEQSPLFKNWFAQRAYIVQGISSLFQRIQRGIGQTLVDIERQSLDEPRKGNGESDG